MIFWAIKHGRHISKFSYDAISINQLIELHRLGYTFEPASNNLILLAKQAGSIPPEGQLNKVCSSSSSNNHININN